MASAERVTRLGVVLRLVDKIADELLDYNAEADKHGERWDALRVDIAKQFALLRMLLGALFAQPEPKAKKR